MRWPIYALKLKTAPSAEPIDATETKRFLDIDASDTTDDTLIAQLIAHARGYFEEQTGFRLINQDWYFYMNDWPGSEVYPNANYADEIEVPLFPLVSVAVFNYYNDSGNEYIFASSNYHVDTSKIPGRIVLKDGAMWPSTITLKRSEGIKIEFRCGYGSSYASVPKGIQLLLKLMVQHLFHNRSEEYPKTVLDMISKYKLHFL